jgi:hypothetical protein
MGQCSMAWHSVGAGGAALGGGETLITGERLDRDSFEKRL